MAITRNAGGAGKIIAEAGEYLVTVDKIETKIPKKEKIDPKTQKPIKRQMLVVHFSTQSEQEIAGYFVKDVNFHMAALKLLKIACGLSEDQSSDELIGRSCGILVEMGLANEQGRSWAQIVGYGPTREIGDKSSGFAESNNMDEVPF